MGRGVTFRGKGTVDSVKGGGRARSANWAESTLMTECSGESGSLQYT